MQTRTTAAWLEHLVPRGVWAAPVQDYEQVFADPGVQGAGVVEETEHPTAGPFRLLRFPLEFSSGGDNRFFDFHGSGLRCETAKALQNRLPSQ